MKKGTRRKLGAVLVVGAISALTYKGINDYNNSPKKFIKDLKDTGAFISDTYQVGTYKYEDKNSQFSYVYCGDYFSNLSEESKNMLLDTTIPTGIIISPLANYYSDIYKSVDYAKALVSTYNIEGPICLKIDDMVAASNVSIDEVYLMVKAFIEKMEANSCYVKIMGHDGCITKLLKEKERAEENHEVEKFDIDLCAILDEQDKRILTHDYDMIFTDKYIYAEKDYKSEIGNQYNNPDLFYDDYVYTARFDTTVEHISEETGLSVGNILRYNNKRRHEIVAGDNIIVPSVYHAPYWKGVDISSYQGNIDFDKFEQVDFAIVRASYTSIDDGKIYADNFANHYFVNLNERKIPTGAYFLTRAEYDADFMVEVQSFFRQIEGHEITLPVFIDIENEQSVNSQHIKLFCKAATELGYTPGIYINNSRLEEVNEFVGICPIWSAGGYAYDDNQTFEDMYILNKLQDGVVMFQTSQQGSGSELGIGRTVDYNYADGIYMSELIAGKDVKQKTN